MLFWTSEIDVPDTSVPKPKNANTDLKSDFLTSLMQSAVSGKFTTSQLTPDQKENLRAWRPPRDGESNYFPDSKKALQETILRESWVKAMMLRLVRDQLNACYKDNGVNHYENCAHLSELYLKWMREGYRVRGGKLRMKVDTRKMVRGQHDSRIPNDAPLNRRWMGIDGKGTTGPEED